MRKILVIVSIWVFGVGVASSQTAIDTTIRVTATTSQTTPYITLGWPAVTNATGNLSIWRREKGAGSWGSAITISSASTSYADSAANPGIVYEYSLQCPRTTSPSMAYGAIVAGFSVPLVENRGKVILLVDNTMTTPLAPEIKQLEQNLIADGWIVYRHDLARQAIYASSTATADYALRLAEIKAVRTIVQNDYNSAPGKDWALFILGHIPVPYSGQIAPDGHGEHAGAWPTDSYYADINGTWTDTGGSSSTPTDLRNLNVVGDGKFDQGQVPSDIEIQCGRVDLYRLVNGPTGLSETERLRQYLMRDHLFRRNLAPYKTVARRAIIDDNFGYFYGEAFASSGWRTAFSWCGINSGQVDALDWFSTLGTTPVLFAYGCGAGGFNYSMGVGFSASDFNKKDSKAVFTMLFGSWFGDWDSSDNFLNSPLGGTADSLGLSCVWSGRGYFDLFHMAMGETIGYSTRYTQNSGTNTGDWPGSNYHAIQANLMGDPTLRLHSVAAPTQVTATSTAGGIILNWVASTDSGLSGYHVYRSASTSGPFTRITGLTANGLNPTGSPLSVSTATYTDTDSALVAGTAYTYLVKTVKMENSPSGTYANQSLGTAVTITHQAANPAPATPTRLAVSRTAGGTCVLTWDDNSHDETGFQVERRNPSTGVWSLINSPSANATTYTDTAATVGQIVHYRVRATGSSSNSDYSNEATDYNRPGLFCDTASSYTTTKGVGIVNTNPRRFNGSAGSVSISYATTALLGVAGTDFTTTNSTVSWNHGEMGTKSAPITILSPSGTQTSKIIKVTFSSPTNGLALNTPTISYIFVTDPTALSLPSPWQSTAIGNIVSSDSGYAEQANGVFGLATRNSGIGGYYIDNSGSGTDSLRFLYQNISGDFQLTARVTKLISPDYTVRGGVMVRAAISGSPIMDSLFVTSTQYCMRYNRTSASTAAVAYSPKLSGVAIPRWLRMTRSGSTFHVEHSSDGVTWTPPADASPKTFSDMPSSVYVGLGVCTDNGTNGDIGCKGYAQFDNVTLYSVPSAVTTLTVSTTSATRSGQISLTWSPSSAATTYLVERSTTSGSGFVQVGSVSTHSYTDSNLTPAITYYYRVKAINPAYRATAYSSTATSTPYIPATVSGWNYTYFGSEASTGSSAPMSDPDGDGIPNFFEYALGLNPTIANTAGNLPAGITRPIGENLYLTYTFVRNKNATDLTYAVEVSSDPAAGWTSLDPLSTANQFSVLDNSPSMGLQTITVKDFQPATSSSRRFMRLKVFGQ